MNQKRLLWIVAICVIAVAISTIWSQRYVPLARGPLYLDKWRGVVCYPSGCPQPPAVGTPISPDTTDPYAGLYNPDVKKAPAIMKE
jgi:hypothetical protein